MIMSNNICSDCGYDVFDMTLSEHNKIHKLRGEINEMTYTTIALLGLILALCYCSSPK